MENNNVLLIKNATILDVEEKREIEADILIKNGKIAAIEQTIDICTDNIIDAGKRYVTSGLVDCHTHLGLKGDSQGFEGIDHNEKNDPVTPQMRGLDGINPLDVTVKEALAHGVTTVGSGPGSTNVFGGTFACIKTYGECVDMRRICGLMLFCFGLGMAVLLFIPETIFTFLFVIGCLVLGYNLFCC